jgi:hypothetical protein
LLTAIIVAYPTVWLAAGARGRYFMPIYPIVAVLIGLLVDRCSSAEVGTSQRRGWQQFTGAWCLIFGVGAFAIGAVAILPAGLGESMYQPRTFCMLFAANAFGCAAVLWKGLRHPSSFTAIGAISAVAVVATVSVGGAVVNVNVARWNNPIDEAAEARQIIPRGAKFVSLSPMEHRFLYYYGQNIAELPWPRNIGELPADVDYFCFMRTPKDTAAARMSGRGRTPYWTPGTLPFAWQELTAICIDRQVNTPTARQVVIGRVIRPIVAKVNDVTVPQRVIASRSDTPVRR